LQKTYVNSAFDCLQAFERSGVSTPRGYKRLANQLAHQVTSLPFTLQQKKQFKAERPLVDEPRVRKILRALRKRPNGLSRKQISEEVFARNLDSAKISEALECLRNLGLADSVMERVDRGRHPERWFAT
jgi:hypothetical protein